MSKIEAFVVCFVVLCLFSPIFIIGYTEYKVKIEKIKLEEIRATTQPIPVMIERN